LFINHQLLHPEMFANDRRKKCFIFCLNEFNGHNHSYVYQKLILISGSARVISMGDIWKWPPTLWGICSTRRFCLSMPRLAYNAIPWEPSWS